MSSGSAGIQHTTTEAISENAFYGVLWSCMSLCIIAFGLRAYIRYICFRRLLVDDYLMIFALLTLLSLAILGQLFLSDIYLLIHVQNGIVLPPPDFLDRMSDALRATGLWLLLSIIGIWAIKLNFLLFFHRIGHQLREYYVLWWLSLIVVTGCGAAGIGIIPYTCMFGDIIGIITECSTESSLEHIYTVWKVSVILDVCSDAIIICFPVAILWKARISLRQKLFLSGIFCLVGFTIGVTIIRGSIFGGVYKSLASVDIKVFDATWVNFWFFIEYSVSFVVACLVSFRSLWARREQKAREAAVHRAAEPSPRQSPHSPTHLVDGRTRFQRWQDSVLNTFNDFEDDSTQSSSVRY